MLSDRISSIFWGLGGIDGDGSLVALDLMNNDEHGNMENCEEF